jgi:hypothetical protein
MARACFMIAAFARQIDANVKLPALLVFSVMALVCSVILMARVWQGLAGGRLWSMKVVSNNNNKEIMVSRATHPKMFWFLAAFYSMFSILSIFVVFGLWRKS